MNHKQLTEKLKAQEFVELVTEASYSGAVRFCYSLMGNIKDGILFAFESHAYTIAGERTGPENAEFMDGKVYFNISNLTVPLKELKEEEGIVLKPTKTDGTYTGAIDLCMSSPDKAIEILVYLRSVGTFLPKWVENPSMILLNSSKEVDIDVQCKQTPKGQTVLQYRHSLIVIIRFNYIEQMRRTFNPFAPMFNPNIGELHRAGN